MQMEVGYKNKILTPSPSIMLQGETGVWVCVFLCGDYEFLTELFRLSGASG